MFWYFLLDVLAALIAFGSELLLFVSHRIVSSYVTLLPFQKFARSEKFSNPAIANHISAPQ